MPGTSSDQRTALTFRLHGAHLTRRLVLGCIGVALLLGALDLTLNFADWTDLRPIRRMFNIAREDGIATWFSVVLLMAVSAVVALLAASAWRAGADRKRRWSWTAVAMFFGFMAVDDAAEIHERLGSAFKAVAEDGRGMLGSVLDAFPSYPWQLVVGPFFAAGGLIIAYVVATAVRSAFARRLLVAGLLCYVIAVGIDFIEGLDGFTEELASSWGVEHYTVRHLGKLIEELLEMVGTALILGGFVEHATTLLRSVSVEVSGLGGSEPPG